MGQLAVKPSHSLSQRQLQGDKRLCSLLKPHANRRNIVGQQQRRGGANFVAMISQLLLQSALDDQTKLLQNGYPQGIVNFHVNDELDRNRRSKTALYLWFFSNQLISKRFKSCIDQFHWNYYLVVTQPNHCSAFHMPNAQSQISNDKLQSNLYRFSSLLLTS